MNRLNRRPLAPSKARGYSLIEVLLTLLIVGVGILGLSAANLAALRARGLLLLESTATQLASDMMERMRAQAPLARQGAFNRDLMAPAPAPDSTDMATRELGAWLAQLQTRLPSGMAAITVSPQGRAQVLLQWTVTPAGSGSSQVASVSLVSNL